MLLYISQFLKGIIGQVAPVSVLSHDRVFQRVCMEIVQVQGFAVPLDGSRISRGALGTLVIKVRIVN